MRTHKNDLSGLSAKQLLARRRRLAGRIGDPQHVLAGSLVEQRRRCGKPRCRCAEGQPHGPYAYFHARDAGRGGAKYVPSALVDVVRRCLQRGSEIETVLAEISAVNAELLARGELE